MAIGKSYSQMVGALREPQGIAPKRKRKRLYIPVFKEQRIEHSLAKDKEVPGRMGLQWEHVFSDLYAPPIDYSGRKLLRKEIRLMYRAPYDEDAMRKVWERGGLKKMIDLVCPYLNAERKLLLRERIESIMHAKQRQHEKENAPALPNADREHRARRLSKRERRALREGKGKRILK